MLHHQMSQQGASSEETEELKVKIINLNQEIKDRDQFIEMFEEKELEYINDKKELENEIKRLQNHNLAAKQNDKKLFEEKIHALEQNLTFHETEIKKFKQEKEKSDINLRQLKKILKAKEGKLAKDAKQAQHEIEQARANIKMLEQKLQHKTTQENLQIDFE
eukprot:UN33318